MEKCSLLVPRKDTEAARVISEGSAVVSDVRHDGGKVLAWFEGNLNGASNLETFYDRTVCAAGRLVSNYPTVARRLFRRSEFTEAAAYSFVRMAIIDVSDSEALEAWAGESIKAICGVRLEPGTYGKESFPPKEQLSYLGSMHGFGMAFRSRAGQALLAGAEAFEVLDDGDRRAALMFSEASQ